MAKKTTNPIPKWLKKTQQNSWEPEIFISGIVLFGLLQLPQYLEEFRFYFSREIFGFTNNIDNVIAFLVTGIQWMVAGLILHLFFRGVWIGLVGLSYVFPKGLNHSRLKFKGKFEKTINVIPDFTWQIIRLEKISSSIFSITYLIFMCLLAAYAYMLATVLIPFWLLITVTGFSLADFANNPTILTWFNFYSQVMLLFGLLYFIDFLTVGAFKRIKYVHKVFYPIYKVISIITFSALYRNIYYMLVSNFKRWKVIVFMLLFVAITTFLVGYNMSRNSYAYNFSRIEFYGSTLENYSSPDYYRDMNPSAKRQRVSIQSDIVTEDVLRVFITHQINFEDSVRNNCNYTMPEDENKADSVKLACLQQFYQLNINDSTVRSELWKFHHDPVTGHRGTLSYIDISTLKRGPYELNVSLKNYGYKNYAVIPFYVD